MTYYINDLVVGRIVIPLVISAPIMDIKYFTVSRNVKFLNVDGVMGAAEIVDNKIVIKLQNHVPSGSPVLGAAWLRKLT